MSSPIRRPSVIDVAQPSSPSELDENSYTALRLRHATPQHLYLTTRRLFIGPIPEGWLKSYSKNWYKHYLHIGGYSSRQATFHAGHEVTWSRMITGIDSPLAQERHIPSFPQPTDVDAYPSPNEATSSSGQQLDGAAESLPQGEQHELESRSVGDDVDGAAATTAVPLVRASQPDSEVPQVNLTTKDTRGLSQINSSSNPRSDSTPEETLLSAKDRPHSESGIQIEAVEEHDSQLSPTTFETSDAPVPRASLVASSSRTSNRLDDSGSTSALIHHESKDDEALQSSTSKLIDRVKASVGRSTELGSDNDHYFQRPSSQQAQPPAPVRSHIQFLPEDSRIRGGARKAQAAVRKNSLGLLGKNGVADGQILRMEKMLVRVDTTPEKVLPPDYDENGSQGIISRVEERWKEYMVVCRQSSKYPGAQFVLLMYKTRVISAVDQSNYQNKAAHIIPVGRKLCNVNLYSALDKTVVVWTPQPRGTRVYILRPQSCANSVEWCTFIRSILGWRRSTELEVNVPDLSVQLRIANPFTELERLDDSTHDSTDEHDAALEVLEGEKHVSRNIVNKCLHMLEDSSEYGDITAAWLKEERVGLAWKRYDRLEWVHGAQARKMYGTIAMARTHELELRPKAHYPTIAATKQGGRLTEPPPVEGFLIRLTSQRGAHQRYGKMFFKRLYFSTHDHYLVFCRPAKAQPPPPPTIPITAKGGVPSAHQISSKIPIVYAVNPYPINNGEVSWLHSGTNGGSAAQIRDRDAHDESLRKQRLLENCDGFVDLCQVVKVRAMKPNNEDVDEDIDNGSDVGFGIDVPDTSTSDGTTKKIGLEKTFELVLTNGLVIRIQAFDKETRKEWVKRLHDLIKYWKLRHAEDVNLYKSVRQTNLDTLHIDEEVEAIVGQFARKWEVKRTFASPELYHMCGLSCCRSIHLSGPLYRKPRRRGLFVSTHCVLIPGRIMVFATTLRTRSGKSVPHIHHDLSDTMDLSECYLYSGLLTEDDLLYQNTTFDSNNPGHNALPRMWIEENWTSRDEDNMTCFVIWQPTSRSWFRRPGSSIVDGTEQKKKKGLARVSQLGTTGRSIVFKARSRAERDRGVLAIAAEIERLQGADDVRMVKTKKPSAKPVAAA